MTRNPNSSFTIGKTPISKDSPVFFIADIAANHDGDLNRAVDLIHSCAEAGANAAKFQNFRAETIVSDVGFKELSNLSSHQSGWKGSVFEVYKGASIPMDWTPVLKEECDKAGIEYFTAPYDLSMIEELSTFVSAWKVGSGDITWHENIRAMAGDGKPVLLATGASDMSEVEMAVEAILEHTGDICLMQCNTNYTGDIENLKHVALNVLRTYEEKYPGMILGLSDHTPGHATVLGAVALGARVVEKHYTYDISAVGPDHKFSMSPETWRDMVDRTRELEAALGPSDKRVMENEKETVILQRRAVRAARDLAAGHVVSAEDLMVVRPCPPDALPPWRLDELVGRKLVSAISREECVKLNLVE